MRTETVCVYDINSPRQWNYQFKDEEPTSVTVRMSGESGMCVGL